MSCEEARMLLDAFVDGELTAEQESALMDHVNACEACKHEFDAAVLLRDVLGDMDDDIAVPLEAQAAWRNAVRQEAKKRNMKKWTRWAYAAAAALVLVVGCTAALNADKPGEAALPQQKALVLNAENGLIAKDGAEEQLVSAASLDESYSAWKKFEAEDIESACGTIELLAAEYSGSCFVETQQEGQTAICRIELPRDYMEDFLAAASRIGTELDSETMESGSETAVIYIQLDKTTAE